MGCNGPSRGTFTFTNADRIANLAKANSQLLRGDDLARFSPTFDLLEDRSQLRLHNQLPGWVTSGNFNNSTLLSIVQNHCSTVVGRYKGQM
ncbi:hypothetical protein E1B28_013502 [Marasmius oreades]|uniref:GH10 domain-containing protein n=1 Tax=Marasmius oreades TaxID=181124 RepID=A0A9P7RQS3_9AGAR|nr:uncharacterized protein E1B28_013502 [Marasmius oreades]KAG7087546.1 hypothetical protein E1B28_013502 [Marasmius oreades]